ncbi:MAG: holo-ACP synthase [Dehalococcoidales bacterium]|jgi:holo-[acyl-carrier protein] synthase|nr:holo-ACP synthase [Dehalococcoidales bacterium]
MINEVSTGIDIIEISRIKEAVASWDSAFLNRVYTRSELDICKSSPASLAGRFAAKEAVLKAINSSQLTCNWREIEILASASGRPLLKIHGNMASAYKEKRCQGIDVSISHCRDYAVAVAVARC